MKSAGPTIIIVEIVEIIENAARTTEMSKLSEEHGLMICAL